MPNKNNPAGGTAGRGQGAPASGGADVLILHQPAPPVKPLSAHLRRLADLAAAEAAKAQGDYANFCRLRRLGLSHQMVWCALIAALENVD